ncbi:hypothetical protein Scep_007121 [Stephania cephalantha]|uniref:Uncharacterized protein n=1 Tax=Stephania cephalantha TaxID=152367 RepID=A0AAP0KAX6_9MAGN
MVNERNIHWVRVKLTVNAPLPSLYPAWERYVEECAKGWRDGIVIREIVAVVPSEEGVLSVVDLDSP